MTDEGDPGSAERRGTGEYTGPERRRCDRGQYCVNVAEAKAETKVLEERVTQEYKALHTRLDEFGERLRDLPKEIAAQMEKNRDEVNDDLKEGSTEFKNIKRHLRKIERRQMLFWFLLAVALFGDLAKVVALFWPAIGKLLS